jgi:hypothetical protein
MEHNTLMIVQPGSSIGPFQLGMTRQQIRDAAAVPWRTFIPNEYTVSTTDHFPALCVQADYDTDGFCEFITSYDLTNTQVFGRIVSNLAVSECADWLRAIAVIFDDDDVGLICRSVGVSFFVEGGLRWPDEHVKAVHVFREGYYDS